MENRTFEPKFYSNKESIMFEKILRTKNVEKKKNIAIHC